MTGQIRTNVEPTDTPSEMSDAARLLAQARALPASEAARRKALLHAAIAHCGGQPSTLLGECHLELGNRLLLDGEQGASLEAFRRAQTIFSALGDAPATANALRGQARVYRALSLYPDASRCLLDAMEAIRDIEASDTLGYVLQNLAVIAAELQLFDEAIDFASRAIEVLKDSRDISLQSFCLNEIAATRVARAKSAAQDGQHEFAMAEFAAAAALAGQTIDRVRDAGPSRVRVSLHSTQGTALAEMGDFAGAEQCFLRGLADGEAIAAPFLIAHIQKEYAEMLLRAGKYERALELISAACDSFAHVDSKAELAISLLLRSRIVERLGDVDSALALVKRYLALEFSRRDDIARHRVLAMISVGKADAIEKI